MNTQDHKEPRAVQWAQKVTGFIEKPWVRLLVPLLITLIALLVLRELSLHVKWSDVQADISATSWKVMFFAACWTVVSFISLSFYDIFAVRSLGERKVPLLVAGMAGASGYAVSNCLG
ncbi:MAG: oxacillin resistance protein FmtC, partial [Pseudomonadota bacterium]